MSLPPGSVDLHTHTRHSDGMDTPAELVAKCARQGVRRLAVTDHDTLAALPEAYAAGEENGVEVYAGIELSVQHGEFHDIHLLGYFFDPQDVALGACLGRLQEGRTRRGLEILRRVNERLVELGLPPLSEDCVRLRGGVMTRPHLARALVNEGRCRDHQEAFRDYLVPCNVAKASLPLAEGIRLVTRAGGVCSLAHPGILSNDPNVLDPLLADARTVGLVGLEVYHRAQHPNDIRFFEALARRHGLAATGGSDYHGHPNGAVLGEIAPGHPVPAAVLDRLREVAGSR